MEFTRLEQDTALRFHNRARATAVIWAFLVAFAFQASAPALLHRMSIDPELRLRALQLQPGLGGRVAATESLIAASDIASQALETLAVRHPELATSLEEVSGQGSREMLIREMRDVLGGRTERDPIVAEYVALLDQLSEKQGADARGQIDQTIADLARLDIGLWSHGVAFYWPIWRTLPNWLGVLLMGVLLTFGAPFWYERLKDIAALRSALERPAGSGAVTAPSASPAAGSADATPGTSPAGPRSGEKPD